MIIFENDYVRLWSAPEEWVRVESILADDYFRTSIGEKVLASPEFVAEFRSETEHMNWLADEVFVSEGLSYE